MNLAELIQMLLDEGLTEEDAAKVAAATMTARNKAISKTSTVSAQQYNNGVDYGEETPAQAKERWIRQEIEDPNGVFGGGSAAGGVFGDGVIITDTHDPSAYKRSLDLHSQLGNMRTQAEMLRLMQEVREELKSNRLPSEERPKALNIFGQRILGSKKKRRC